MDAIPAEAGTLGEPEQPAPRKSNVPAAVFWMVGTLLSFSLMAISIRQLGGVLKLFELLVVRAAGGLAILLIVMAVQPSLFGYLVLRKPVTHLIRNGTHFCANLLWANAVIVLPLATVFAIEFMMPVWAGLLAVMLLGERFTVSRAGTIPATRHRSVPAGCARRAHRVVRLLGVEYRDKEVDPGAEHDCDPVLDEPDAGLHGPDRRRSALPAAP